MKNLVLAGVLATTAPLAVGAFAAGSRGAFLARRPVSSALMSSPEGGWENDDFLSNLGGGGGDPNDGYGDYGGQEPVERIVPENNMSDEEITMMAMRAAQFYNTDTSMEEAYGTPRQGPPRKQEPEEEEYGEFQ